jgi:hypothetical protein
VGRHSFDDVRSPNLVGSLTDGLRAQIDVRFQRYGLNFVDLQSVQASCDDAGLEERKGELWLAGRETQLQRAAGEVEDSRR